MDFFKISTRGDRTSVLNFLRRLRSIHLLRHVVRHDLAAKRSSVHGFASQFILFLFILGEGGLKREGRDGMRLIDN